MFTEKSPFGLLAKRICQPKSPKGDSDRDIRHMNFHKRIIYVACSIPKGSKWLSFQGYSTKNSFVLQVEEGPEPNFEQILNAANNNELCFGKSIYFRKNKYHLTTPRYMLDDHTEALFKNKKTQK